MHRQLIRNIAGTSLLAIALPSLAPAQGLSDMAVIIAPHSTAYTIGTGATKKTVSQTAIPIVFSLPFTERFTMDITTAYAVSDVISGGRSTSAIHGLTDTQVRGNFSFANQTVPAAGTLTINFSVTCAVPTGTVLGTITKQQDGSNLAGVTVVVTPTSGAALAAVTTAANGGYSRSGVPTVPATGSITLSTLPAGCVNAGPYTYSGHTTAGTTRNIVVSCPPAPVTYPVTGAWTIVNAGPTGRQAQLVLSIDMGTAPGSLSIDGANADPLAGITFNFGFNGTQLAYSTRNLLSIDEFDLGVAGQNGAGTASASTALAIGSGGGLTKTGNFQLVRVVYNIAAGVSGTLNFTGSVSEALATTSLVNITSSVTVNIPALIVP